MMKFLTIVLAGVLAAGSSHASVVASLTEKTTGVSFEYSGSFDTSNLGRYSSATTGRLGVNPSYGHFGNYPYESRRQSVDLYWVEAPEYMPYGTGYSAHSDTASGDIFSFGPWGSTGKEMLLLPEGYVSGSQISGKSFYEGLTFATLGVVPGSFNWTLSDTESITLNIGPDVSAVPLPAGGGLLLAGLGALGIAKRRRKTS